MFTKNNKRYKVIIVTPAGRQRYMEILLKYILANHHIIDEYQIWQNTHNQEDIQYFKSLSEKYSFIRIVEPSDGVNGNLTIHRFFKNCIDDDTIYIRFDDDIVYLEDNFFTDFLNFRIDNPQYFLVFPNIINNAIIDHLHQRLGIYDRKNLFDYHVLSQTGWNNPELAYEKHKVFLSNLSNNLLSNYKFRKWELYFYERVSINCISWFGEEFAKFNGEVGSDEETWLTTTYPAQIQKMNCIYGNTICCHFSFYTQRPLLDSRNLLSEYRSLAYKT